MKKHNLFFIIFLTIFLVQTIMAECLEGQVDINTATKEELMKIKGIGTVKAQDIINARPFNSLDDLINVKGIGEKTLANITRENLACVSSEAKEETSNETKNQEEEDENEENDEEIESTQNTPTKQVITPDRTEPTESIIKLTKQKEINKEQTEKVVYKSKTEIIRKYSIPFFSILLIVIIFLIIKK